MSNTISKLRGMEINALATGGTLSAKEAADMLAVAKKSGAKEDLAALKEMFSHDAFASPKVAQKFLKKVGGHASPIAGQTVGNTTVVRSYGAPEGYSNKFQAIAIAQEKGLVGFPTAVVKDGNNKWHAVQTREALTTSDKNSGFPVKMVNVSDWVAANKLPETTDDEKVIKATKLAMASLGVPAELISAGAGRKHFDKDKINIDVNMKDANGKTHVHNSSCSCGKAGAAVELSLGRLKNAPDFAAATLFHEGQHKADDDVRNGQLEKGTLTATEKSSKSATANGAVSNESSAYGRTFLATVDKNKEVALDQLLGYLDNEINQAATPNKLNTTLRADMVAEMKAHFTTLPPAYQEQFKQVIAVAELYHPKSSLWTELFGKEAKPAVSKSDIPVGGKPGME